MREVSSPIYQPVKVEGPSFPMGRARSWSMIMTYHDVSMMIMMYHDVSWCIMMTVIIITIIIIIITTIIIIIITTSIISIIIIIIIIIHPTRDPSYGGTYLFKNTFTAQQVEKHNDLHLRTRHVVHHVTHGCTCNRTTENWNLKNALMRKGDLGYSDTPCWYCCCGRKSS